MLALAAFLLLLPVVSGAPIPAIERRRSIAERVAFACAHKPSLSLCSPSKNTAPTIHAASQAPRRGDSPTPKRRLRWVFVPHSGTDRFWNDVAKSIPSRKSERKEPKEPLLIIPPDPFPGKRGPTRALQSRTFPVLPSDAAYGAGQLRASDGNPFAPFAAFDPLTDAGGLAHRPRSRSPFTKPGLWEPNPDDPHSRDPANKWYYRPESVGVDWLNGQAQWGGHWAVPAAGVGGTMGQSALHFPSLGTFLGIPDDYD